MNDEIVDNIENNRGKVGDNVFKLIKAELRKDIGPVLSKVLENAVENEEASKELVTELLKNEEVVITAQGWNIIQDVSERERLSQLMFVFL